ncbi:hypothetical protein AB0M43_37870 [Longispora sp. NPDC051575]|uniref:hypothetical protein n=1 Tax=Longispora sp. NPDC051575 TaxID=3154943 RepID=UPI003428ED10
MAKQDAWESTTDPTVDEGAVGGGRRKKIALLVGALALVGAGLALTKGRRARRA